MRIKPVTNWPSYVPLWGVLKEYRQLDFSHDLVAGLVVGVITVPQAIAYAFLAGLPPQAGLYACLAPMVLYAILGSSRQLVVGPVAVAALMVAGAVGEYAPAYSDAYLGITTVLSLQAGLFLLALRASSMGGIVNLLSHPVIVGFINAAALLIIISQLGAFTGIPTSAADNPFDTLMHWAGALSEVSWPTIVIGTLCLVGLWLVRFGSIPLLNAFSNRFPAMMPTQPTKDHPVCRIGPLIVTIGATLAVVLWNLDAVSGIATVGAIAAGLPELTLPPFELSLWIDLAPTAAMIALVSYVESYSIGTTLATRQRTRLNSNQELIALGAANISAAFTGAYPVAGSFSRSSVNYQAGGRTPVSSLICSVVIVLTLSFFTPLFERLPHAALAAIVMVSVLGLIDLKSLVTHWKIYRHDAITSFVTLITVLVFGVETGLITGVALSVAFFIRTSSRPNVVSVGRIPHTEHFRAEQRYAVETNPKIAAVRVDENLYFANVDQIENKLMKLVQRRPATRHLLLVCNAVNMIDVSGLEMLYRLNRTLDQMGVTLHLSEIKASVMSQLASTDFVVGLTGRVFFTSDQAMQDLTELEVKQEQVASNGNQPKEVKPVSGHVGG